MLAPAVMNPIRMCLLLWTDDATSPRFAPLLGRLKRMGYDGVEVPVFDTSARKLARLGRRLDDLGLDRNAITALAPEQHLTSPDAATRRRGLDHLRSAIDGTRALGASLLSGPICGGLGAFTGKAPTAREWRWAVEGLRAAAGHAAEAGVTLALEYLNRFEIYLVTCAADARRLVRDVDHPSLRMMFDTFHANIEEKDPARAILESKDLLVHIQLSECDRSTPGAGGVAWDSVFSALRRIGYRGAISVEAFGQKLPRLAAATKIWRRMFRDEETLARDALAFVRSRWNRGTAENRRPRK